MVRPGFHDHHLHLLAAAARRASVDVSAPAVATLPAVLARIAAAARAAPAGAWIRAWGHDEALAADGRAAAAADLDRAAPGHPVVLHHRTGHVAVLNASARRALRERAPGAEIPADGVLVDAHRLLGHVPRLAPAALDAAAAALSRAMAAAGITAVTDATSTNGRDELLRLAALVAGGHVRQRVGMFVSCAAVDELRAEGWRFGEVVGGVQILHAKIVVTGETDPARLRATVAACARRGWPVALHATDLGEVDTALAALEAVASPPGTRHRIEHLSLSLDDQVARIARLPVTVVTNPAFLGSRGAKYARELSADERGWLYRVRSLLAAGVRVRAGSDAPVTDPDPLAGARCAVLRGDGTRVLGAEERVDAHTALRLFAGASPRRGDRVVLSEDPARGAGALARARVLQTTIRGEPVLAAPPHERSTS